jgi:hypothetical protein
MENLYFCASASVYMRMSICGVVTNISMISKIVACNDQGSENSPPFRTNLLRTWITLSFDEIYRRLGNIIIILMQSGYCAENSTKFQTTLGGPGIIEFSEQ